MEVQTIAQTKWVVTIGSSTFSVATTETLRQVLEQAIKDGFKTARVRELRRCDFVQYNKWHDHYDRVINLEPEDIQRLLGPRKLGSPYNTNAGG